MTQALIMTRFKCLLLINLDLLVILEQIIAAHIPQLEVRLTDTVNEMFGR
jgi:hypothetical protein